MDQKATLDEQVRRVQEGDLDAYEDVVLALERPIRGWIVAHCPPGGDADEVAQKTFVAAFRSIDQYQPGTDFRAWLFTIARYQLLAECTRLQRSADYHSRYLPHALSEELRRRAEQSADGEPVRLQYLRECLEHVKNPARRIIEWRYTDELPLADIAGRTGRSVGAIKKQLFTLRKSLHECIQSKIGSEAT